MTYGASSFTGWLRSDTHVCQHGAAASGRDRPHGATLVRAPPLALGTSIYRDTQHVCECDAVTRRCIVAPPCVQQYDVTCEGVTKESPKNGHQAEVSDHAFSRMYTRTFVAAVAEEVAAGCRQDRRLVRQARPPAYRAAPPHAAPNARSYTCCLTDYW